MEEQFSKLSINITKKLNNSEKKNQGIFFTPLNIIKISIDILDKYFISNQIKTILEPSCGSCEFIKYIDNTYNNLIIDGIELNKIIYNDIRDINYNNKIQLINDNFITYNFDNIYDLIIGNPPYFIIKKDKIDKKYYKYFTGRPNIYIIFIIKSLELLNNNGILCFVLPKNFLNCLYYNKLRKHINNNFKIIDIIDCYNEKYIETQQDTVLFIIQKVNFNTINNTKYYIDIYDNIIYNNIPNIKEINNLLKNSTTLSKLGFNAKIGTVVWNQEKSILTDDNTKTRLIYSGDIITNELKQIDYKNINKKNYINKKGWNKPLLVINRG